MAYRKKNGTGQRLFDERFESGFGVNIERDMVLGLEQYMHFDMHRYFPDM